QYVGLLVMALLLVLWLQPAYGELPAIPSVGIDLAEAEHRNITPDKRPLCRWVWSNGSTPQELDDDFIAVTATINMALNCSSLECVPQRCAGNSLMLIDFSQLVNTGVE